MPERERLLDRLSKLLALAKSTSEHEAATARRLADDFMSRHGLTRADVDAHDASAYCELSMGAVGWNATWRFALATVAARHCGAEAIALQSGKLRKVKLAGARGDVERAQSLYQQLLDVERGIERLAAAELADMIEIASCECGARRATDSFRRGVVLGIALRLARSGSKADPVSGEGRVTVDTDPAPEQGIVSRVAKSAGREPRTAAAAERLEEKYEPERRDLDLDDVGSTWMFELGRDVAAASVGVDDDGRIYLKKWHSQK